MINVKYVVDNYNFDAEGNCNLMPRKNEAHVFSTSVRILKAAIGSRFVSIDLFDLHISI